MWVDVLELASGRKHLIGTFEFARASEADATSRWASAMRLPDLRRYHAAFFYDL
jgi:hypothetical protein